MKEDLRELNNLLKMKYPTRQDMRDIIEILQHIIKGLESSINLGEPRIKALEVKLKDIEQPKHETVQQWEERTGMAYPDDGPVWLRIDSGLWPCGWILRTKEEWLNGYNDEQAIVVIANEHGRPEDV